MIPLQIIAGYLILLIVLGVVCGRLFKGTAKDYFLASHSIGPIVLLMSIFGTTMTAFALVGSTGQAYKSGIGVYGLMASWSGLIHSAVFFLVGIKIWALGKKHGYLTQIEFFRERFNSNGLGYLLFPILVGLVIPYLLIGLVGAEKIVEVLTKGAFPDLFTESAKFKGGIPPWITGLVISTVVLGYVFFGGIRATAWANTFQTAVFMVMGFLAFWLIADKLGGLGEAIKNVAVDKTTRVDMDKWKFASYLFVPLSVGMFPHLFQNFLTAKSSKTFKLSVIAHPVFIMLTWVPCILIGIWATSAMLDGKPVIPGIFMNNGQENAVLGFMIGKLTSPVITGLVGAGILAAIMSSLDSQFLCMGTIFTNDIVFHKYGKDKFTEKQQIMIARGFIVLIVLITYFLSLGTEKSIFSLAVWCFSGFAGLFPLIFSAIYWKGATKAGAFASVSVTALVWFYLFRESGYASTEYLLWDKVMPVVGIFVASAVSLIIVSLLTQKPDEETLNKFFPKAK